MQFLRIIDQLTKILCPLLTFCQRFDFQWNTTFLIFVVRNVNLNYKAFYTILALMTKIKAKMIKIFELDFTIFHLFIFSIINLNKINRNLYIK